jgi:hypothetical protein
MFRRQPHAARLAHVAVASMLIAAISGPSPAAGEEVDVGQWFSAAAAPALRAAAATNDPAVAGSEALTRGLSSAFSHLQRVGPQWLQIVQVNLTFDPTFRPGYAVSVTQPLLRTLDHDASLDLRGGVLHDPTGRAAGSLGLRYDGRLKGHRLMLGLEGAVEDLWLQDVERYTIGGELRLNSVEVRASLFDDVPQGPATRQTIDRRLDGYDLEINVRIPYLSRAWLRAYRFWQVPASGETNITRDRLSLRLMPFGPLEVETGTQGDTELRSWFAQLRWRIKLGS